MNAGRVSSSSKFQGRGDAGNRQAAFRGRGRGGEAAPGRARMRGSHAGERVTSRRASLDAELGCGAVSKPASRSGVGGVGPSWAGTRTGIKRRLI